LKCREEKKLIYGVVGHPRYDFSGYLPFFSVSVEFENRCEFSWGGRITRLNAYRSTDDDNLESNMQWVPIRCILYNKIKSKVVGTLKGKLILRNNNDNIIIILHDCALVFVRNGKCNDKNNNNNSSNNNRQSVSWCGHERIEIMLLPKFLWKRDHNTRRGDAHGNSSLQELRPRTSPAAAVVVQPIFSR